MLRPRCSRTARPLRRCSQASLSFALRAGAVSRAVCHPAAPLKRGGSRSEKVLDHRATELGNRKVKKSAYPPQVRGPTVKPAARPLPLAACSGKVRPLPPKGAPCAPVSESLKCLIRKRRGSSVSAPAQVHRVLANKSLNRTVCGGPRLAIISFLAKHGPPQTPG